jgi:P27 family predicted phage terminase small subunit
MGKRGPKPKPTALRILEGNPSRREINEMEPAIFLPAKKPADIESDELANQEWDRLFEAMPPGIYTAADTSAIATYCLSWSMLIKAQREIALNGVMVAHYVENEETGDRMLLEYKANPAVKVWKAASETLIKMTDRLGLSPGVRSRLELPKRSDKPTDQSKFAGLLGRK